MAPPDNNNSTGYSKVLLLLIGLLIVIAGGYFGVNVMITPEGGVSITHQDQDNLPNISIVNVNANAPDYVTIKNNSNNQINLLGYEIREGSNSYPLQNSTLEPNENSTIYFVKSDHEYVNDQTKIISTDFRIQPGETIELIDSNGNTIHTKKAL
jgi:hypothetical protein